MDRPVMSVVICVYNGADVIGEQLDALSAQNVRVPWELVVADNRSTDSTRMVLEARQAGFPVPLRIIDAADRQGVAHARNVGAKAARGDLLAFCDADDHVGPGWVQAAVDGLEQFDMVGGVRRELRTPFDEDAPFTDPPVLAEGFNGPTVLGNNFACRRRVYFAAGGMDEGFPRYGLDDVELSARVNAAGFQIGLAAGMVVYFRPTEGVRVLARKVYLSGQAEYLVWALYPEHFRGRRRVGAILLEPVTAVRRAVVGTVRTRRVPARPFIRSMIGAVAHARQHVATRGGERLPERMLVSLEDEGVSAGA